MYYNFCLTSRYTLLDTLWQCSNAPTLFFMMSLWTALNTHKQIEITNVVIIQHSCDLLILPDHVLWTFSAPSRCQPPGRGHQQAGRGEPSPANPSLRGHQWTLSLRPLFIYIFIFEVELSWQKNQPSLSSLGCFNERFLKTSSKIDCYFAVAYLTAALLQSSNVASTGDKAN